ncbi:hypothetical protein [Mycolicibacterium porcinum]|uniref:PE-PGRS family protein n=1 Tax=Mycolicibacterium porcinum TaxID=39693 RepID=A0ABV3VL70_9MYCO
MNLALRPYATAGIALVGASVIAVTPISPPAVQIEGATARASSTAVNLAAAVDPITAWANLATNTSENMLVLGNLIAENPAPVLGQIVANWSGYGETLGTALQTAGTGLSTYLTTTLPTALQAFTDQLMSGDMQGAAQTFVDTISGLAFGAGLPMLNVFSIPVDITQNLANAVATLGPSFMGVVASLGLSALSIVIGTSYAAGDSAQQVVDAAKGGDLVGTFNTLAAMPATVVDALINGYNSPERGILTPGLISFEHPPSPDTPPWEGWWPDGLLTKLVKARLTIAKAIGWEDPATTGVLSRLFAPTSEPTALPSASSVPDATAATAVTLSADPASIEPKAKSAPATDVASAPADSATTEPSGSTPTKEEAVPLVRKSLIATPGKADALGATSKPAAKVASDVRDGISATVNKIGEGVKKAFAKPGKADKASTSDAGPSASDTK